MTSSGDRFTISLPSNVHHVIGWQGLALLETNKQMRYHVRYEICLCLVEG